MSVKHSLGKRIVSIYVLSFTLRRGLLRKVFSNMVSDWLAVTVNPTPSLKFKFVSTKRDFNRNFLATQAPGDISLLFRIDYLYDL